MHQCELLWLIVPSWIYLWFHIWRKALPCSPREASVVLDPTFGEQVADVLHNRLDLDWACDAVQLHQQDLLCPVTGLLAHARGHRIQLHHLPFDRLHLLQTIKEGRVLHVLNTTP